MSSVSQRWIPAYGRWIIRWRWPVVIAGLLAAAAAASGVRHLETTSDYRVFFGEDNPQLNAFETLEDTYTKTDNILFVLQPAGKNVFTRETLGIVERLTEQAWQIPHAIRVDSITNFQHTEAEGDDLTVAALVESPEDLSEARLARIEKVALNEPALVNRLIAADARTTGVVVTLQFPGTDHTQHLAPSMARAEEMAAELRAAHPGLTVAITGLVAMVDAEMRIILKDLGTLTPAMYGVIVVLLLVLLRSASATISALLVVSLSAATERP